MAFTSMSANMTRGLIQSNKDVEQANRLFPERVQMPTVQHLLNASLEPTRAAIREASPERDPQEWVALHA